MTTPTGIERVAMWAWLAHEQSNGYRTSVQDEPRLIEIWHWQRKKLRRAFIAAAQATIRESGR